MIAQRRGTLRGLALLVLCLALLATALPVSANGSGTLSVMGRTYTLGEGQAWHGDMAVIGGTAHLLQGSTLNGSISAIGGVVTVDGTVNGDIVGMGATVELGRHAVVTGDLVVLGTLRQDASATVLGETVQGADATQHLEALPGMLGSGIGRLGSESAPLRPLTTTARRVGRWLGTFLALLAAAALAELLLPQNTERVSSALIGSWIESAGAGVLTLLASALLIPLLVIICIGIPVAIVLVIALVLALAMGWIAVGKVVGTRLLIALRVTASTPMIDTLVGVTVLTIAAAVPCLGGLITFAISAWGVGAVLLTRYGTRAYPPLPFETGEPVDDRPASDTHPLDETIAPPENEA